jgi:hypothetical protein
VLILVPPQGLARQRPALILVPRREWQKQEPILLRLRVRTLDLLVRM